MKTPSRLPWLAVLLPLSALATTPSETQTPTEDDTAFIRICRVEGQPGQQQYYCDDGSRCYAPAETRHGTYEECHPDGIAPDEETSDEETPEASAP